MAIFLVNMGYNYGINMNWIPDGGLSEWYTLAWNYSTNFSTKLAQPCFFLHSILLLFSTSFGQMPAFFIVYLVCKMHYWTSKRLPTAICLHVYLLFWKTWCSRKRKYWRYLCINSISCATEMLYIARLLYIRKGSF